MKDRESIEKKAIEIMEKLADTNPCGSGEITLLNRRYVLLSTDYFPFEITKDLEEIFGAAGDAVLYKGGEKVGRDLYMHYIDVAREYGIDIWDIISAVGWYFGWGIGDVIERGHDGGKYVIRVYSSFEADSFIKRGAKVSKPVCHFMRGVLNGIVESVEVKKYNAEETKCRAKGDEFCEFVFNPL